MSTISIRKISITDLKADAIVNAANTYLQAGGGVCGAIFSVAGYDELQSACDNIGSCPVGSAVITPGFKSNAKYIIHAVGPQWKGGDSKEPQLLYSAYKAALGLAVENGCHSIGFPLISAGIFGYPVDKAWRKAIQACKDFLEQRPTVDLDITFAVLDDKIISIGTETLDQIAPDFELDINTLSQEPEFAAAVIRANDLANLGIVAPHKKRYINRYDMEWLTEEVDKGKKLHFTTFWKADKGCENRVFSQWYVGKPIYMNGRKYATAEQYMMSEKALLFNDLEHYCAIMSESDPAKDKKLGRLVTPFDQNVWDDSLREILFHGNLAKLQSDIEIVDALLNTGDSVLVEASPYDAVYGAGIDKTHLLNPDGTLRVHPRDWHTEDKPDEWAQNHLGFVLMGIRDLFRDLMRL